MPKSEKEINSEKAAKPRPDLIPGSAMLAMGSVMAYGWNKHGDCTWKNEGTEQADPRTHIASASRHLAEYLDNPKTTEEGSGLSVLWHAASQLAIAIDCESRAALTARPEPDPVIYLDMDGVIVDFVGGALRAFGVNDNRHDEVKTWDGIPGVINGSGVMLPGHTLTDKMFWDGITACGSDFWAKLKRYDLAGQIVDACEQTGVRVVLMSTPTRDPMSAAGKVEWINRVLPRYARHFSLTACKSDHARSNAILIDDSDKNVREFRANGGRAFLWPQPWNDARDDGDPIDTLKAALSAWVP